MKVKSFTTLPKVGDGDWHIVVIEQDGITVRKSLRISGLLTKMSAAGARELQFQVMRVVCEAERDIAFQKFGDKWPEHVGKRGCQTHVDIACDMAEMRPDLFPDWSATNAHQ